MKKLVATRDGNLLFFRQPSPRLRRILHNLLTYWRTSYARSPRTRDMQMQRIPVQCYAEYSATDTSPPQLVTPAGYLWHLAEQLRAFGYKLAVRDRPWPKNMDVYKPDWSRVEGVEWRYQQRETLEAIATNVMGRIRWPTGAGKSFLISQLCKQYPNARIDITTNSLDVITDLYRNVSKACTRVALITGSGPRMRPSRINCVSGKSLHHMDGNADFLLVDEAHEWATDDAQERLSRYRYAKTFLFSANPVGDRSDGADFELIGTAGRELSVISYADAVKHKMVVPMEVRWYSCVMSQNPCEGVTNGVAKKRRGFWRNGKRNRMIQQIAQEFTDDDQVLIVVDTIEHAMQLKKLLPEFTLCYGQGLSREDRKTYERTGCIGVHEPMMDAVRRQRIKRRFEDGRLKKVIATGVWNRGVDFRNLSVLIRADGKNSRIADTQIPGRVSRTRKDGKVKTGIVIDFVDVFDESFAQRSAQRRRCYARHGWTQIGMQLIDGKSSQRRTLSQVSAPTAPKAPSRPNKRLGSLLKSDKR